MRTLRCGLILLLSLMAGSVDLWGQSTSSDPLLSIYDSLLGISSLGLVNGTSHTNAFISRKTHPFYGTNSWEVGRVETSTGIFPSVRIRYDAYKEALVLGVTRPDGKFHAVQLRPHNIIGFELGDAHFIRLPEEAIGNGYFEVLYEGEQLLFLARRRKNDEIPAGSPTVEYTAQNDYYFYLNDGLVRFRNKSSIFELRPERKADIKVFIKNNKLRIKALEQHIPDVQQLISHMDEM